MRLISLALLAFLAMPALFAADIIFLTRHAEKMDSPASDPPLSPAGRKRAETLARMLARAGVGAIYTTQYVRTRDTAAPLAKRTGVKARIIGATEDAALIEALRAESAPVVLVVGHTNTIPNIVRELGGPEVAIAESDFDNLLMLARSGDSWRLVRLRYP